jgi:hypothetical protein
LSGAEKTETGLSNGIAQLANVCVRSVAGAERLAEMENIGAVLVGRAKRSASYMADGALLPTPSRDGVSLGFGSDDHRGDPQPSQAGERVREAARPHHQQASAKRQKDRSAADHRKIASLHMLPRPASPLAPKS